MERLAKASRLWDFKTVPMILTKPEEWDHEALSRRAAERSLGSLALHSISGRRVKGIVT